MSGSPLRQDPEPDRPCLGGCGQLLMAAAWNASHGHCSACWDRVRAPGGSQQEAEGRAWGEQLLTRLRMNSKTFGEVFKDASLLLDAAAALQFRDQRIKELEEEGMAVVRLLQDIDSAGGFVTELATELSDRIDAVLEGE